MAGEGGKVEGLGKGCGGASQWAIGPLPGCHGDLCGGENGGDERQACGALSQKQGGPRSALCSWRPQTPGPALLQRVPRPTAGAQGDVV